MAELSIMDVVTRICRLPVDLKARGSHHPQGERILVDLAVSLQP